MVQTEPGKFISDKQRKFEIVAVCVTAAGKPIFMDWLQWRFPFILTAILGWATYVIVRNRQLPGILRTWGFRGDNVKAASLQVLPFGLAAIAFCFSIGYFRSTLNLTWHILPILILYPIWGTVQQFLCIGLVAGNLQDLKNHRLPRWLIILVTALLFGLVHYPFYWLMAGTFLLAIFYGMIYLKTRNVWVMGIVHGWLGALSFYTVVGRDPFAEVFGPMF